MSQRRGTLEAHHVVFMATAPILRHNNNNDQGQLFHCKRGRFELLVEFCGTGSPPR